MNQNQENLKKLEKKYQQDMSLFRMENLRKDETIEQLKLKQRKFNEMIQTKVRHLLYRSRELIIPMGKWDVSYEMTDRREDEMVRGFNEVLEVIEMYLNPNASILSN